MNRLFLVTRKEWRNRAYVAFAYGLTVGVLFGLFAFVLGRLFNV